MFVTDGEERLSCTILEDETSKGGVSIGETDIVNGTIEKSKTGYNDVHFNTPEGRGFLKTRKVLVGSELSSVK